MVNRFRIFADRANLTAEKSIGGYNGYTSVTHSSEI